MKLAVILDYKSRLHYFAKSYMPRLSIPSKLLLARLLILNITERHHKRLPVELNLCSKCLRNVSFSNSFKNLLLTVEFYINIYLDTSQK
jgi:hypothetical protein